MQALSDNLLLEVEMVKEDKRGLEEQYIKALDKSKQSYELLKQKLSLFEDFVFPFKISKEIFTLKWNKSGLLSQEVIKKCKSNLTKSFNV